MHEPDLLAHERRALRSACTGRGWSSYSSPTTTSRCCRRSAGTPCSTSSSVASTRMSGWLCASAATAGATMRRNADWKADTRTTPAGLAGGDARQLRLGRLDAVEQRRGVADQHAAGLGQPHVAPAPLEQRRPGLALEHGELLGDRARGVVERPRGAVDGAAGVDLA